MWAPLYLPNSHRVPPPHLQKYNCFCMFLGRSLCIDLYFITPVSPVDHVAALWKHPAGLRGRAVLPDRPAAPLPAAQRSVLLHLDPGRGRCTGYGPRPRDRRPCDQHKEPETKQSCGTFHFSVHCCCNKQGRSSAASCASQTERTSSWAAAPSLWTALAVSQTARLRSARQLLVWEAHVRWGWVSKTQHRRSLPLRLGPLFLNMSPLCRQLFGCDGVLRSGKVRDVCGRCDGDGSTCTLTSDTFTGGRAKGSRAPPWKMF